MTVNRHYYRHSHYHHAAMLYQIVALLLQVVVGLVAGACLLRVYLQYQRVALSARSGNPLGPFLFALTDWLVLPLRRVIRPIGRWDGAGLVGAFLLEVVGFTLLWLLAGAHGALVSIPILALFGLVRLALSGMSAIVILYAVLSWVQAASPLALVVGRMAEPLLNPLRRVIPLVGGVDLSPLVLLVGLQVASIVLQALEAGILA